jgi:DNA-binding transcriptional regulator YdaS (Cro superfamily)
MHTFSKILAKWLGERSAESCAPLLGVTANTLRYWLEGSHLPPATRIPSLAASMGVGEERLRRAVDRDRAQREAGQPVGRD